MKDLAPIVIFAFNRLQSLQATVASLLENPEAKDSDLYVFVDGPRVDRAGEKEQVESVQSFAKTITGFKNVSYEFSDKNCGLGPSIIKGVTGVINRHGAAIVLEDDLIFSKNFLAFMNQELGVYEKKEDVFYICGYSNSVKRPTEYQDDAYFCVRSSSWGWATWADRWNSVDWELEDWNIVQQQRRKFNRWGGSDCFKMLNDWKNGKNKSWAIRFCYSQFIQNKVSLFPIYSKVQNNGFDGSGTNCKKWSRFRCDFDDMGSKNFKFPTNTEMNKTLLKSALSYHSLILRVFSRIMYLLFKNK